MKKFYSVSEAAFALSCSKATIHNRIKEGEIPYINIGSEDRASIRIPKKEFDEKYNITSELDDFTDLIDGLNDEILKIQKELYNNRVDNELRLDKLENKINIMLDGYKMLYKEILKIQKFK